MRVPNLNLPINDDCVETLEVGDTVYLTGVVCTARDMAHLKIKRLLEEGKPLPVDWHGSAVIHAGPVVIKNENKWKLSVLRSNHKHPDGALCSHGSGPGSRN